MSSEKTTILVIDDEEDFSFFLKKNLERHGHYDVSTALNGKEGIEKAKNSKPDLIFLDILMPGMSGFEVLNKLKEDENTRFIPVVMLTGNSDEESRAQVAHLTEDYIEKPAEIEVLRASINKALTKTKNG